MAIQPPTPLELEVQRLNDELNRFKTEELAKMQRVIRDRTEWMTQDRDRAVLAAYRAGSNKAALCRALRTTARVTVYDILAKAEEGEPKYTPWTPPTDAGAPLNPFARPIEAQFDIDTNVLTLTLKDAVLEGMAAAQDEPLSGTKEFRWTGTGWTSTAERKGPLDFQMATWLNAAEDVNGDPSPLQGNALQAALTDAGIYDMLKSVTRTQTTAFDLPA